MDDVPTTMFQSSTARSQSVPPQVETGTKARALPRLRRFLLSLSPATWACLDALIVGLATTAAHVLLVLSGTAYNWTADPYLAIAAFCGSVTVAGLVFGLYERRTLLSRGAIVFRTFSTLALGVVLAFACLSVFFYSMASRWIGFSVALTYIAVALPIRLYAHEVVTASRVRVLCIGTGESIRKLIGIFQSTRGRHYDVVGCVGVAQGPERLLASRQPVPLRPRFRSQEELEFQDSCPLLGQINDLPAVLTETDVDEVVVGNEVASDASVGQAVATCLEDRCRVIDQHTFVEKLLGEVPAESITGEWFLKADVQNHGGYEAVKRMTDVVVSAVGILITLPVAPLIALAIRLDSPGAVLYKQIRVGQFGRCFSMYKFRTMRMDAEADGVKWAAQNDSRVTRLGRFLRRSRIDELPQLINILRGDMSLVGPRPERPEFVHNLEQLLPHYRLRHLVKPGLSGWAQIHYGYGGSVEDTHRKLCYDLYYLKHRSLDLDLGILIRTFGTFVLGAR